MKVEVMEHLILKYSAGFFKWNCVDTSYIRKGIDQVVFSKDKTAFVVIYYEKFIGLVYKEFKVDASIEAWFDIYEGLVGEVI